ncbi:MAG: cytochrome c biogenesis protein CcsA, partial [Actinomycetota bacterium]|nr:cytochrome c biogenesis protein CcsA [Actinomycetota bacterium]
MNLGGLGPVALGVSLFGAGAAAALAGKGRTRPAGRALVLAFAGLSAALAALAVALVTVDGSLVYVADHTSRVTRWPYRVAALWGGMAGSLLLWTWMAAGWAVVADRAVRRRAPALARGVQGVLAAYLVVFSALLVLVSRPFEPLAVPAIDGGGLNPVLLHPAMLYHPPLLYAGAVGLAVPFALALAALVARQPGWSWVPLAVRWSRVSLVLLSAGLLAGAHWAYVELGWGGYWAWDPVENGGLLPWLAGVAFLHAGVVARRRGGPATGAAALAALAFVLGLLGSFLTRSGATESVHAFAEARTVGWALGGALVVAGVVAVVLLGRERRRSERRPVPRLLSGKGAV